MDDRQGQYSRMLARASGIESLNTRDAGFISVTKNATDDRSSCRTWT